MCKGHLYLIFCELSAYISWPFMRLDRWSFAYRFVEFLYLQDKLVLYEFKYFDLASHLSFLFVLTPFCNLIFFQNF